jgi:hypothetical protein
MHQNVAVRVLADLFGEVAEGGVEGFVLGCFCFDGDLCIYYKGYLFGVRFEGAVPLTQCLRPSVRVRPLIIVNTELRFLLFGWWVCWWLLPLLLFLHRFWRSFELHHRILHLHLNLILRHNTHKPHLPKIPLQRNHLIGCPRIHRIPFWCARVIQ